MRKLRSYCELNRTSGPGSIMHRDALKQHHDELVRVLAAVPGRLARRKVYAESIWNKLHHSRYGKQLIWDIRHLHDPYIGAAYKHPVYGQCAGALYRSTGYMRFAKDKRDGGSKS